MHNVDTCELVRPSSIIAQMHRDHVARQQRISAAAVGQKAIAAAKINVDDLQIDILEKRWAQRQNKNWFSLIEEIPP